MKNCANYKKWKNNHKYKIWKTTCKIIKSPKSIKIDKTHIFTPEIATKPASRDTNKNASKLTEMKYKKQNGCEESESKADSLSALILQANKESTFIATTGQNFFLIQDVKRCFCRKVKVLRGKRKSGKLWRNDHKMKICEKYHFYCFRNDIILSKIIKNSIFTIHQKS